MKQNKDREELPEIKDKEWIRPSMSEGFIQECCDCGLKHLIKFKIIKTKKRSHVEIQFIRLSNPKSKL